MSDFPILTPREYGIVFEFPNTREAKRVFAKIKHLAEQEQKTMERIFQRAIYGDIRKAKERKRSCLCLR